jgi:hypothetical protein
MTELILLGCGADYTSCALTPPSLPPRYNNVMTSPPASTNGTAEQRAKEPRR